MIQKPQVFRLLFFSTMVLLSAIFGCVPAETMTTATPVEEGEILTVVDLGYGAAVEGDVHGPHLAGVSMDIGISPGFELGMKLGGGLMQIRTKGRLSPPEAAPVVVSLMGAIGGMASTSPRIAAGFGSLTLLLGLRLYEGFELVVAPKVLGMASDEHGGQAMGFGGGTLGLVRETESGYRVFIEGGCLQQLSNVAEEDLPEGSEHFSALGCFGGLGLGFRLQ